MSEMKKIFGSKFIDSEFGSKKEAGSSRMKQKQAKRKMLLSANADSQRIPLGSAGIYMDLVSERKGELIFAFKWTREYMSTQRTFQNCVDRSDVDGIMHLLMYSPYHIDSLLQICELMRQSGEYQKAEDLIQRCLYCLENSLHPRFKFLISSGSNDLNEGNSNAANQEICRVKFRDSEENRGFFMVLFRWIQMLGRKSCHRTALEFCKLVLSLDETDPLFIFMIIDFHSIQSKSFSFLLSLVKNFAQRGVWERILLPNTLYSVAVSSFLAGHQSSSSTQTDIDLAAPSDSVDGIVDVAEADDFDGETATNVLCGCSADDAIKNALYLFPMVLPLLAKKLGAKIRLAGGGDACDHVHFKNCESTPHLDNAAKVFVERHHFIWKAQNVQDWLARNVKEFVDALDGDQGELASRLASLRDKCLEVHRRGNLFQFLHFSEYSEVVQTLPADIMQQQEELNHGDFWIQENAEHLHQRAPQEVVHAPTNNPLGNFLWSLMPWNEVPNAPAVQNDMRLGAEGGSMWDSLVAAWTQQMQDEEEEANEAAANGDEQHEKQD
eukprot:TRINITY_DN1627_c1_g1_i1.p1 TRINITY_DN1627_c1_g1~~TRINITY_DN1627_c1_g1_i1.p1  ORF type:complete len:552 (+),score=182.91 TRINITY_DN1627_c1_g1_i1:340-1995(+)